MTELSDTDLLAAAKRASERREQARAKECRTNTLRSAVVTSGIVDPATVGRSPKCSNSWCRYRLMLEREQTRGICDDCSDGELRKAHRRELQKRIPAKFRDVSLEKPAECIDDLHVAQALEWLKGGSSLLTIGARRVRTVDGKQLVDNPTASGKSTLAGMVANSAIAMGKTIEWFDAADLDPVADARKAQATFDQIVASEFAIIDGFGKELIGAHPDSDIAIRRKGFSAKIPQKIHTCKKGQRFVLTLDVTKDQGIAAYGAAELRRIASPQNATVIVLTRNNVLDLGQI